MALATWPSETVVVLRTPALRLGLMALSAFFCVYVIEKEVHLGRLTRLLADERVLTAALTNRLHEVQLLLGAGKAMNAGLDLPAVLDTILSGATELLAAHGGSVMLVEGDELVAVVVAGRRDALDTRLRLGDGVAGHVALRREPVLIDGEVDPKEFPGLADREPYVESAMSVPLVHRDELVGRAERQRGAGPGVHRVRPAGAVRVRGAGLGRGGERPALRARARSRGRAHGAAGRRCDVMSMGRPRILIVEDDPDLLVVLRVNLASAGLEPILAADGRTAVSRVASERPDAVLLDVMLPGIDGWQVLEQLHAQGDRVPVVVCSAKKSPEDIDRAMRLGAVDYLVKPFDIERLVDTVMAVAGGAGRSRAPHAGAGARPRGRVSPFRRASVSSLG